MAHRIRDAGNEAAHPDDPDWEPASEEADEALAFLTAVAEWLYVLPAQLREVQEGQPDDAGEPDDIAE